MFVTKSVTSPRQTRLCRSNGIQFITIHGESWRQSPQILSPTLSRTQIMKVGDMIYVVDFHGLCPRQSPSILSQSQRNGIWPYPLSSAKSVVIHTVHSVTCSVIPLLMADAASGDKKMHRGWK